MTNKTHTLIILRTKDNIKVRCDMPTHEDQEKGYPWFYIDEEGNKFYPIYYLHKYRAYIVAPKD
jgi:hypothetical protein